MNGPTPEAEAKIKSNPKSSRTATIGISHHSLRFHRNVRSSPTTPIFDVILRIKFFIGSASLSNHIVIHIKSVDVTFAKSVQGICGCGNDGFAPQVEAGVQQDWHTGRLTEELDSPVVQRVGGTFHRLDPSCASFVGYSLDAIAAAVPGRIDHQHIAKRIYSGWVLQIGIIFSRALFQNYRSKGAEWLTKLDARVDDFLHLCPAGISQDGAVTQRSRAPFEASLEEGDDFARQHVVYHHFRPALGFIDALVRTTGDLNSALYFMVRIGLTPVGVFHNELPRMA